MGLSLALTVPFVCEDGENELLLLSPDDDDDDGKKNGDEGNEVKEGIRGEFGELKPDNACLSSRTTADDRRPTLILLLPSSPAIAMLL